MKLKKTAHNHKEIEKPIHKKSKSMDKDIEPALLHRSPGGYFGRKWFPFTPYKAK